MISPRLTGRGDGRVFGFLLLLVGVACADADETQTYSYTADPVDVTRTDPPSTTVTVAPNQPGAPSQPDVDPPGEGPAQESLEPEELPDLNAVGGAGGFGGTSGLGGSGGVGGGQPLGGASSVDVSADDEADGLGGTGFGGTGFGGTGSAGTGGNTF